MYDERALDELILRSLEGAFDEQRFVGALLGEASVLEALETQGAADPQALVALLDEAARQLASSGAEMDRQVAASHRAAVTAEMLLRKSMGGVRQSMAEMAEAIEDIERRFQEVGSAAVRIGERLATSEQQRRRLAQAEEWLL
jgi:hypothetical protein